MSNYSKLKVMLVDDESLMLDMLGTLLRELGINNVIKCSNGTQARTLHEQQEIDLTFLDIEMPDVNGLELLDELKREYPERKIVMLSGSTSIDNVKKAIDRGADSFIAKPYNQKKIYKVFENYFGAPPESTGATDKS